jgi:hypothetical protein
MRVPSGAFASSGAYRTVGVEKARIASQTIQPITNRIRKTRMNLP